MPNEKNKRLYLILGRILIVAVLVAAVVFSGKFSGFMNVRGLLFVLLGSLTLALASFSIPEIVAAFKHAAGAPGEPAAVRKSMAFWEAAARNAWMTGVLGTILNFIVALCTLSGGMVEVATRMATSFLVTVYGMVLAVICAVPAWKLGEIIRLKPAGNIRETALNPAPAEAKSPRFENVLGCLLFLVVVSWMVFKPVLGMAYLNFSPFDWIIHWPSLLVVLGGTIVLVLFVGSAGAGRILTPAFAITGLIGSLMGFIQVLLGFASRKINLVSAGITFVIASCFMAMLGMMLVGGPWEDRLVKRGRIDKSSALSRAAVYGFPILALIFLVVALILVITPMKKG
ncbi:MAG: MotA/TolQ/ExbB proton channel family protein [Candidatus Aminicenantes bacterium]|nr:MotA/TolQ/ExbB proton channel family protein [Candidatus Aminicenantes bacterium]